MKVPMRLAATIIVALTIFGGALVEHSASAESQDPGKVLYDRGREALAAQRYGEGITLLETLVASYPQSPYAEPGRQALQKCIHLKACATARGPVEHGGGMTFFPNMPMPSSQPH
jgi:outer membrane protein assembly factor BamD (BamD/ComL family)